MIAYLEALGFASVVAATYVLRHSFEKRQFRALQCQAAQLGLSLIELAKPFEQVCFRELAILMPQGSSTQVEDLVQGTVGSRQMLGFNLRAYSSLGEGTTVTAIVAFQSPCSHLPAFEICLKSVVDRWRSTLEHNGASADFDLEPAFKKRFLLSCRDNIGTHEFFSHERLRRLLQCLDGFQLKSSPHWLVIARPGEKIGASNLRQLLHAGSEIAACLLDSEPQTNSI